MTRPALTVIQSAVLERTSGLGLPPGARVLDAPCGTGALTLALAELGFTTTGADLEPPSQTLPGASFRRVDLNAVLPWADISFDAVFSTEGIEHLEDHFGFLRELCRILKRSGVLVITTPNIVALRSRVRFFGSGFFGRDPRPLNESARHPLHHIGLATFPQLQYELHTCGFHLSAVSHTHIKPVSYLYAFYAPWMWLYTKAAFRKEKDREQRKRNQGIVRTLFTRSLLFGESILLVARKSAPVPPNISPKADR